MTIWERLFEKFTPLMEAFHHDETVVSLHLIGGSLIAITFFTIGVLCFVFASVGDGKTRSRARLTYLFGTFLIFCGLSRAIDVLAIFHAYQIINGIVKIVTGAIALAALLYIPYVVRHSYKFRTMSDVQAEMETTKEKLEQVQKMQDKLDKK